MKAVLFIGNAGAGKSTLLKLLGATDFESGVAFREGYTTGIHTQTVNIQGEETVLMDVPGIYEPNNTKTIGNAAILTEALRKPYEFKLYFILKADNRGPGDAELMMMHRVNEVVRQEGTRAKYIVIVNQIMDSKVYDMYKTNVQDDNCESLFEMASIEGYSFDIKVDKVILVRFNESTIVDTRGETAKLIEEVVTDHKAARVTMVERIMSDNEDISRFRRIWNRIKTWFAEFFDSD